MFMGFRTEVNPSFEDVFEPQDRVHQSLEMKQEEDWWWWMERRWEERMLERDLVALVVNRWLASMAGEKAVMEIEKRWYIVSVIFLYLDIQILTASL